ncbi:MAG: phage tail protein [Clostridia bacterium]|nr:phage tail protein [Clostridia bacterium]
MADLFNKNNSHRSEFLTVVNDVLDYFAGNRGQKYSAPTKSCHPPPKHYEFKDSKFNNAKPKFQVEIKKSNKAKQHGLKQYEFKKVQSQGKHKGPQPYDPSKNNAYPFVTHRFLVEIDGIPIGAFSEVSGLEINAEMGEYQEGGRSAGSYHYIKKIKYSNIILKRGMSKDNYLWDWYKKILEGNMVKKDMAIILLSSGYQTALKGWTITKAFPVKWSGSPLSAGKGDVMIETLELAHSGILT